MDGTAVNNEIHDASGRLPERQRKALALCELERYSYDEIAAIMGTSRGSVAQLISRARINLYDELRGTVLASIAAPSPECERALPLIAEREDGQLASSEGEGVWLDAHLTGCERCRLAVEQMGEAGALYRAGAPMAAESEMSTDHRPESSDGRPGRRRAALAVVLVALLLSGFSAVFLGDDGAPAPARPAAATGVGPDHGQTPRGAKTAHTARGKREAKKKAGRGSVVTAAGRAGPSQSAATPIIATAPTADGGGAPSNSASSPSGTSGKTAVNPTQQASPAKPSPKPKPAPTSSQASQPSPESPPPAETAPAETPPPAEESPDEPGHRGEPPGKPAGRPPR